MSDCAPDVLAGQALTFTLTFTRPPQPGTSEIGPQPCAPGTVTVLLELPDGTVVGLVPDVDPVDAWVWYVATPALMNLGRHWMRVDGVGGGCTTAAEATWNVVAGRVTVP